MSRTSRIYPIWWDTTLTVYNKYVDKITGLVSWHRHIVHNCFWKYTGNKVNIKEVVIETNDIICRVPFDDAFLDRYKWVELPNDKMDDYFTFGKGDIIVKGEVDDNIDEYTKGMRSTDFIKKFKDLQGCMVIDEYTTNTGIGRCSEHYYVKGS